MVRRASVLDLRSISSMIPWMWPPEIPWKSMAGGRKGHELFSARHPTISINTRLGLSVHSSEEAKATAQGCAMQKRRDALGNRMLKMGGSCKCFCGPCNGVLFCAGVAVLPGRPGLCGNAPNPPSALPCACFTGYAPSQPGEACSVRRLRGQDLRQVLSAGRRQTVAS